MVRLYIGKTLGWMTLKLGYVRLPWHVIPTTRVEIETWDESSICVI